MGLFQSKLLVASWKRNAKESGTQNIVADCFADPVEIHPSIPYEDREFLLTPAATTGFSQLLQGPMWVQGFRIEVLMLRALGRVYGLAFQKSFVLSGFLSRRGQGFQ